MMESLFYRPRDGWLGDCIPYFASGAFRIFYLRDQRDGNGFSWYQLETVDFVTYIEHNEAIARGTNAEPDRSVWTGSVIERNGLHHLFYTGYNPAPHSNHRSPRQAIMHAVSEDLTSFRKISEHTFYAPSDLYESLDWRDPFVFWNEQENMYWMLVTARLNEGPSNRRGCLALCASTDLNQWTVHKPFWAPNLYSAMECPELFQIGDWWYLVFSTFTERFVTQYRMSKHLSGPWIAPENDTFDGRAFYAAKSFSDGKKRFLFGWNPTKAFNSDFGDWHWGGNLVVHELVQHKDGTLSVTIPEGIDLFFNNQLQARPVAFLGKSIIDDSTVKFDSTDQFSCVLIPNPFNRLKICAAVTFGELTRGCGVILGATDDLEKAYFIRLEPSMNRLVFDYWPRKIPGIHPMDLGGDVHYQPGMERPLKLEPGTVYNLTIIVDDTICVAYIDNHIALSCRFYSKGQFNLGFFVNEGTASFTNIALYSPAR